MRRFANCGAALFLRRLAGRGAGCQTGIHENLSGCCYMSSRASDIGPDRETGASFTGSGADTLASGSEKAPADSGLAWVDACRPSCHHALASEDACLGLAEDAITGLRQALTGRFVSVEELDRALGVVSAP